MKRSIKPGLLAAAAILGSTFAPGLASAETAKPANNCRLGKVAELPVTMSGMRAIVTLTVNGEETPFILDTGAWFSMVTAADAKRLKLKTVPDTTIQMEGIGGQAFAGVGVANEVTFSGKKLKNVQFLVGGPSFGEGSAGLIGQNFLHQFDVEYDMANGIVRLFIPHDCRNVGLGYWANGDANILPLEASDELNHQILAKAQLNGRKIKIQFDSGADTTILDKDAADKTGVPKDEGVEAGGVTSGIGKRMVETWVAPITNLDLGEEQIKRTHIRVGALGMTDTDMLVGMDFFLSHRMLVSNSQKRIYFTYNGGAVFNIGRSSASKQIAAAKASEADDKLTVAELTRRAAAFRSRRNYAAAVADLDRAIKLEPDNAKLLVERASAHLSADETDKGKADLEKALKLKPDSAQALEIRGFLRLEDDDLKAAKADFEASVKAAPNDESLRLEIASAYAGKDHFDLAISQYDQWLLEHPKSSDAWTVLNSRCWVRAEWNHDLDQALADCDAAVKKGQRNSSVMDSRGMVHLRLGHYKQAVADYDIALARQSRSAWSYLGRGLAKEHLGDTAGAQSDLKQALALDPDLTDAAHKIGLESALLPKPKPEPGKTAGAAG